MRVPRVIANGVRRRGVDVVTAQEDGSADTCFGIEGGDESLWLGFLFCFLT
jgi:hypothetical protein